MAWNWSTCFPFSKGSLQALPKPIHMFSLIRLLGDYEKCLSLELIWVSVTCYVMTSVWACPDVGYVMDRHGSMSRNCSYRNSKLRMMNAKIYEIS